MTLIGSEGQREVLACPGGPFFLGTNAGLWGTAPVLIDSRPRAGLPGETIENTSTGPRDLSVPIRLIEDTDSLLDQRIEALAGLLRGGDIQIVVDTAGTKNTTREIVARYVSGLDAVRIPHFGVDARTPTPPIRVDLRFVAYDPFWRDVVEPVTRVGPILFENGFFALLNEVTVNNAGGVPAWPRWLITGRVENVEAMNTRTGKSWRMTEVLEAGDTMEIVTDPRGEVGCYLNGGQRAWSFDALSELWELHPGVNEILVRGLDPTAGGAIGSFEISWLRQYDTC